MKKILFLLIVLFTVSAAAFAQDTIITKSGLKYVSIKAGNGKRPGPGDKVSVYYTGTLTDGTVFDSNRETNEVFKFTIGKKEVIPGWEEGLQLMSKGERGIVFIPAKLAYGAKGVKDGNKYLIPPNSPLKFEIELVNFK